MAEALRDERRWGVRVLLVSTGAEEANQEGMLAFARRHFATFRRRPPRSSALEMLGSGELVVVEGEGFLRMYDYPEAFRESLAAAAPGGRPPAPRPAHDLRERCAHPARHGIAGMLCSVNEYMLPPSTTNRPTRPIAWTGPAWPTERGSPRRSCAAWPARRRCPLAG